MQTKWGFCSRSHFDHSHTHHQYLWEHSLAWLSRKMNYYIFLTPLLLLLLHQGSQQSTQFSFKAMENQIGLGNPGAESRAVFAGIWGTVVNALALLKKCNVNVYLHIYLCPERLLSSQYKMNVKRLGHPLISLYVSKPLITASWDKVFYSWAMSSSVRSADHSYLAIPTVFSKSLLLIILWLWLYLNIVKDS